ncbi:MAG: aspartate kinase [Chlamydiia bacterium]|nr:aspartate kinase [Chlamydiia bacterium]
MKFGGAAMANPRQIQKVAEIIAEEKRRVIVVVSAMGTMTDELIMLAHEVAAKPPKREMDMLLSVGERVSMALLAMALEERGTPAISLTGSQAGMITCTSHGEAYIKEVRPHRVEKHLSEGKVVIIGGFQGVSEEKEITTLGRGGSDTSAVALALALGGETVTFYKDVKGIHSEDPKKKPDAPLLKELSFDQALSFSEFVIHKRAILLASKNGIPLHVKSFNRELWNLFPGTWIRGVKLFNANSCYLKGCVYESRDERCEAPA